ncbi:MAG: divergent PAP2 family protein [Catonella sp.]|nr:divergent PAP2 family protein [Catonella sp.]MDY6357279.1 divergent PAP2 family protein [Catonella sp.]
MNPVASFFYQLFINRILWDGLISWAVAQVAKAIINACMTHRFSRERLFGDGGMPSGHSATVTSVALATGAECGFDSPVFAVAAIVAIIVMHDAMGVRYETGKQAKVLNRMIDLFKDMGDTEISNEKKLKEFVGHSPMQVLAGFALGVVVTVVFYACVR